MTVEQMIMNATGLVIAVLIPLAGFGFAACAALLAVGKITGQAYLANWGSNSFWGALIAAGGATAASLFQNLAGRIWG